MKEGQEKIYYVTAETFTAAKNSPHLEIFRKKGIEVLLLSDRVDEWVTGHLTEFDGKQLQSVAKGGLDLGKLEDAAEKEEAEKGGRRVQGTDRKGQDDARREGQGRSRHAPPDRFAVLPGRRRVRPRRQPAAHPQGRRPAGAGQQADPRNQPAAPGGAASEVRGNAFRRLGQPAARAGDLAEGGALEDPAGFVKRINDLMLALSLGSAGK
jgi:molecular chaperone HtpG